MSRLAPHEQQSNLARERWSDPFDAAWKHATLLWVKRYAEMNFSSKQARVDWITKAVFAATQKARERGANEMRALYEEAIERAGVYEEVTRVVEQMYKEAEEKQENKR